MTIQDVKQIKLADYLQSLGYTPVKQQGKNLWYKSPLREETDASFKVNTELEKWYDFGIGKGGNILALAAELYYSKIEAFMNRIYCHALKAKSSDKTDIRIILHDRRTKINSEMGFSIKSQLGGDSTLLNASKATNFNFKIEGTSLSDEDIAKINSLNPTRNKVIERYKAITKKGCKLIFDKVDNSTFRNNLIMLDGDLPSIIANLLLEQLNSGVSTLKELVEQITETNPLGYDTEQASPFYAYKIKHLLTSAALGMMPATAWSGKFDANGGYLVVKKDGEILCYHFYDRNRFEDYLFSNAYLERSSTSRHEYASIIKENDGTLSFKLNFQVRLK